MSKLTYALLLSALMAGDDVRITVQLDQCTVAGSEAPGPAIGGGFRVKEFLVRSDRYIDFSTTHETVNARGQVVTELVWQRISRDGKMVVRTASARSGELDANDPVEYVCELGVAVNFSN